MADYALDLERAEVVREGTHVTIIAYGTLLKAIAQAADELASAGILCEVVDLQTIMPYDAETLIKSVKKTGRCLVVHEAPETCGMGAEICAKVQQHCFLDMHAPATRLCGYDTPFPFVHEPIYLPTKAKIIEAVHGLMNY